MNENHRTYDFFSEFDPAQKKILIIDDDDAYRQSIARLLKSYGFIVFEAADGQTGIETATTEKPDIILADVVMPRLRGIEMIRRLRLQMGTLLIPVVVITGVHDVRYRIEAYQAGADAVMEKPVDPDELFARIERSLVTYDRLSAMTHIDALTGIYNRRYFDTALNTELNRALRHQQIFSLVMLDIDFFKHFNDQYGHHAGDFVLRSVATFVKQSVRKQDIVSRYGGEEFTVIMPLTAKSDSGKVLDRIRQKLSQTSFDMDNGKHTFQINISVGVAQFPDDAQNETDLINASDQAMYQAKNNGRNNVVIYQPIPVISPS